MLDMYFMKAKTYCIFCIVLTFLMILWGGALHQSGQALSCPTWPLCWSVDEIRKSEPLVFVYLHRFFGFLLGIFSFLLICKLKGGNSKTFRYSIIALVLILIQSGLGGISAFLKLPSVVTVTHMFFSLSLFAIFIFINGRFSKEGKNLSTTLRDLCCVTVFLLMIQIMIGGISKHTGASSACGLGTLDVSFKCFDTSLLKYVYWPTQSSAQWNMIHKYFGIFVSFFVFILSFFMIKEKKFLKEGLLLFVLVISQGYSGSYSLVHSLPLVSVLFHLFVATVMFSICTMF